MDLGGGCFCGVVRYRISGAVSHETCSLDDPNRLPPRDHTRTSARLDWVETDGTRREFPEARS